MQQGIATYLNDLTQLEATTKLLQGKRDFFLEHMKSTKFTWTQPAQGSYFQVMNYQEISDLPDKEFAIWLTEKHGVAAIPLSPFYSQSPDQRLLRFCFAKKEETLLHAIERLRNI
jgi:methionine aminotransferase